MTNEKIEKQQENLNERLAKKLKQAKIRTLQVISLGNSIATGYSMVRTTKPLLLRNATIERIMKNHGITLTRKQFSRAQNNSDEHILEWILENVKESTFNEWNTMDFMNREHSLKTQGLTPTLIEEYYPKKVANDRGVTDWITTKEPDTANIVIYNGCTGSFLDGMARDGSLFQQLFYGVNRDVASLEAILKWMQTHNRKEDTNIEMYLCGVPNLLGIGVSELINYKIKKLSTKYANTTYINPVITKVSYPCLEDKVRKQKDVHYDEEEYQRFTNHILSSIIRNHSVVRALISLDRQLFEESRKQEFLESTKKKDVEQFLMEEMEKLETDTEKKEFLKIARAYLLSRFPYDFYYLGRKNLLTAFQKVKR